MILVQRYDPNISNVIETIRDDLANGVGGIWLTGADKRISEIIEAVRDQKPEIYLDEASVEIKNASLLIASDKTSPAEELAEIIAKGLQLRATRNVRLGLKADAHIFMTMAKYRAARWLWAELTSEVADISRTPLPSR